MGQSEVLDVLKKFKDKWYTVKQLSVLTHTNNASTTVSCKKLRNASMVQFNIVKVPHGTTHYVYKYKGDS